MAVEYDPYSHELHRDPYPVYRELRDRAPVYRHPEHGFYALTRHADVVAGLNDWRRLSSAEGITLEGLPPDIQPEMITMDPPRHDELRDVVKAAFTPKRIAALEPRIRELATGLVGAVDPADADLVRDVGVPLPGMVMAELLGVPLADRTTFRSWADALTVRDVRVPATIDRAREASAALAAFLRAFVADRRRHDADDLLGVLLRPDRPGAALDDDELVGFCRLLLLAGGETTTHLVGNGLLALARHPDQRAAVASDPGLLPGLVEETLRYDAPVQALARTATTDLDRHGVTIEAGAKVLLVFGSANRDEREFDEPDRFDVHRPARSIIRHVAFGHGIHHCLGAALARMEGRIAFGAVLARFPSYELAVETPEPFHSGMVRGPAALPLAA